MFKPLSIATDDEEEESKPFQPLLSITPIETKEEDLVIVQKVRLTKESVTIDNVKMLCLDDRYELVSSDERKRLGAGEFGAVWQVRALKSQSKQLVVALKYIFKPLRDPSQKIADGRYEISEVQKMFPTSQQLVSLLEEVALGREAAERGYGPLIYDTFFCAFDN